MFKYETSDGKKFEYLYGEVTFLKRNEKNPDILSIGIKEKKTDEKATYLTAYGKTADVVEKICKVGEKQTFLCFVKQNGEYTNYNVNRVGEMNYDVTTDKKDLKIMKGSILYVNKKEKFITLGVKSFGMQKEDKPIYITFGEKSISKIDKFCEVGNKVIVVAEKQINGDYTNYNAFVYSFEQKAKQ